MVDTEQITDILTLRYHPTKSTLIPPLVVSDFATVSNNTPEQNIESIDRMLKTSIEKTIKGDTISIALSGGVDSSLALAKIREVHPKLNIHCITVGFYENDTDFDAAKKLEKDPTNFIFDVIKHSDFTGIVSVEKYIKNQTDISEIKKQLSYPGTHHDNPLYQIFDQIFYGPELYQKLFNKTSNFSDIGLIEQDDVILNDILFEKLQKKFNSKIAMVTGRGKEAVKYLKEVLSRGQPNVRMNAIKALGRIKGSSEEIIPLLTKELPKTDSTDEIFWLSLSLISLQGIDCEANKTLQKLIENEEISPDQIFHYKHMVNHLEVVENRKKLDLKKKQK